MSEPLTFEAFRDHLAEQLEVSLDGTGPQHRLADDIELDSVQRIETLVAIEDLGANLSYTDVEPQQTLGGLHERYTAALLTNSES